MSDDQPSLDDAREQADEHQGFLRSGKVTAHKTGEEFTIPNLQLLDDDQQAEYDKFIHELQQCDRYPDVEVPEQVVPERVIKTTDPETGEVTETTVKEHTVPARTIRGDFIEPYQKTQPDGTVKLIEPPYNVRMTQILLGKEGYKRFKAAGGRSSDVRQELLRMKRETEERMRQDSKSGAGAGEVESVPNAD